MCLSGWAGRAMVLGAHTPAVGTPVRALWVWLPLSHTSSVSDPHCSQCCQGRPHGGPLCRKGPGPCDRAQQRAAQPQHALHTSKTKPTPGSWGSQGLRGRGAALHLPASKGQHGAFRNRNPSTRHSRRTPHPRALAQQPADSPPAMCRGELLLGGIQVPKVECRPGAPAMGHLHVILGALSDCMLGSQPARATSWLCYF